MKENPPVSTGYDYGFDPDLATLEGTKEGGLTLTDVRELVEDLVEAEENLAEAQTQLNDAEKRRNIISRDLLPGAFETIGLNELKTTLGEVVTIKEKVRASIYAAKRAEGHQWLEDHGQGGKIKRFLVLDMGKCGQEYIDNLASCIVSVLEVDDDPADALGYLGDALCNSLSKHIDVSTETKVPPSTFSAMIRRWLEAGDVDLPEDLFSIFQSKEATIKRKKV